MSRLARCAALLLSATSVLAQGDALRLKSIELEGPCFALSGKAPFVRLEAQTKQLFGVAVSLKITERELELTPGGGRGTRIPAARGKELTLTLGEDRELPIRIERVELGGHLRGRPDEGMAPAWIAYPHIASEARFGKKDRLVCIDLDADGVLWEPDEDGVVHPDSRCVLPLRSELIVGLSRYRLSIGEQRGKRAVFAEELEEMRGIDGNARELAAMQIWNRYRTGVGVPPSWLDPQLSKDCAAHCRYMQLNAGKVQQAESGVHTQDPSMPGYSEAGSEAGKLSCIWSEEDAEAGIRAFVTSLYHKWPLLFPHTPKCGLASRHGATLYDGQRGREGTHEGWPLLVPGPGQTIHELAFGHEIPDPRPENASDGGHAILLVFDYWTSPATQVKGSLARHVGRGRWEDVPVWVSDPTAPAHRARPQNDGCICLIPQKALAPRSTYRPRVEYTDKNTGQRRVYEWEFETR